jgi:GntR family transcriptional regulator, colanic acid and biofilm gene transcriptional regulator
VMAHLARAPGETAERQIYRTLRKAIMSGAVAPGSGLSSRSLAEAFGVSAMPVREALKRLEADGALYGMHKSAFFLNNPAPEEFEELLEMRLRLEGLAVRRAAARMTETTLKRLRSLHKKYSAGTHTHKRMLALNFMMHFEVYRCAGWPKLLRTIENLWLSIGPLFHYSGTTYNHDEVSDNHGRLLSALERGDGEGAERALRADLQAAAKAIRPILQAKVAALASPPIGEKA